MRRRLLLAPALAVALVLTASAQVQKKDVPGIRNYSRVDATDGWTIDRAREEAEAIGLRDPQLTAFATTYINAHR